MREYCVKITETRYEYVEARNEKDAIAQAEQMVVSNADCVECEGVNEPGDEKLTNKRNF